ncbi:MAG: hypothetical protein QNJ33_20340 [Crocosphaera sp.]|nr:hypothetical protein [Crocosphaera sp.]
MLVILTHDNILSVNQVCPGCLLADQQGTPRWHHGKLGCGHSLDRVDTRQAKVYECEMGFQVTEVDGQPA